MPLPRGAVWAIRRSARAPPLGGWTLTDTATGLRAPLVVWFIVIAIVGCHIAFMLAAPSTRDAIDIAFALIPARFHGDNPLAFQHWYDAAGPVFGHAFLHVAWWHAGLNAFFFFLLGRLPAQRLGPLRFLALFLVSAAGGALAFVALNWNEHGFAVGASGAVCGVFTAFYLAQRPTWLLSLADASVRNQLGMIFFINVVVMGAASESGVFPIAWEAHLGGFVGGGLAFVALAPRRVAGPWG